jgi:predicted dinucleotide-binding enzyme
MKIGIIGAGQIGGTLTRNLTKLGHQVRVANSRDPITLEALAAETGATAVWAADAAADADLVIVSIPQKNVVDLAPGLLAAAKGSAPIIETNNYYPQQRDGLIAPIEAGTPESVWVAQQLGLGEARVYKVFNGIWWKTLLNGGMPAGERDRIALPVAGADGAGKQTVLALVEELGFDGVDAGTLAESWRQQPGTPVYGKDFGIVDTITALAQAAPERPAEFRASA